MAKPMLDLLKVVYVVKIRHYVGRDLLGKELNCYEPEGAVHLFELVPVKDGEARGPYSLCGKCGSDIGEVVREYKMLLRGLTLCPDCEAVWKSDPRGLWHKWLAATNTGAGLPVGKAMDELPGVYNVAHESATEEKGGA